MKPFKVKEFLTTVLVCIWFTVLFIMTGLGCIDEALAYAIGSAIACAVSITTDVKDDDNV